MKKLLSSFLFILISFQAFSLGNRYFELRMEVPASVSNSSFFATEILKKDLVIDLPALSNTVPKSGFSVDLFAKPSVSMNLDLRSFYFGINCGVDVHGSLDISKNLFDFLAVGNKLNEEININASFNTDAFVFIDTTVGFDISKVHVKFIPGFFSPILHTEIGKSDISFGNNLEGLFIFNMNSEVDVYSHFDSATLENFKDGSFYSFNPQSLFSSIGFDLATSMEYKFYDGFTFIGYMRIPFVPAKLKNRVTARMTCETNFNLSEMLSGENDPKFDYDFSDFEDAEGTKKFHRPFKFMIGVNWDGFRSWLNVYADLGLGVRYPFSNDAIFYPEYILGMDVSLFNILGLSLSAKYCDKVFSNKIDFFINTRVLEIDVGASIDSSSFLGSFKIAGVGAYVAVSLGF